MKVPPPGQYYNAFAPANVPLDAQPRQFMDPMQPPPPPSSGSLQGPVSFDSQQRKGRKPHSSNKPAAPAKSVATASRAFFKGMRRAVQEASNLSLTANLARSAPGSHSCQVGIAVLAVGHGLTDNKNGRVSKEEEQRAARRKPQAFLMQDGQISQAVMHSVFRAAIEGPREGSPPADITMWESTEQMEKWFARREAERSAIPHLNGNSRGSGSDQGEGADSRCSAAAAVGAQEGWYGQDESRGKAPTDVSKWLREECQSGLDEDDIAKLMHCFTHPDWGIKNKELLFALSEQDLIIIMTPIRDQALKNFIFQKCRKYRQRDSDATDGTGSKKRKTSH